MPANNFNQQQIIQIPGQNGQPGQMIIVPKGNIIVLPSNAEQGHGSGGFQTLQCEFLKVFKPFKLIYKSGQLKSSDPITAPAATESKSATAATDSDPAPGAEWASDSTG